MSSPISCRLVNLKLSGFRLRDSGARFLAQALKTNVSLRLIDLSNAKIGPVGHINMAEAALLNTTLKVLDLTKNQCVLIHVISIYILAQMHEYYMKEHARFQLTTLY